MKDRAAEIREVARGLLQQKEVDLVVGFETGSLMLRSTPCFVRGEPDVDRLVWNRFCDNSLAKYLPKRTDKLAIIAKACDARAVVELIKENQIPRQQVIIVGVPCEGMVSRRRLEAELDGREVTGIEEKDGKLIVTGEGFSRTLDVNEYLEASCQACAHPNPPVYDILVGEPVTDKAPADADASQFGEESPHKRWQYITAEVSKCMRCYACRQACPMCYCQECFVDKTRPQWIGKTPAVSDTRIFLLMRAFHLAGRCVECGACERACPMGVDIRTLNRKLAADVKELFCYETGLSLEESAPLSVYRPDDSEEFMLKL